MPPRVTCVSEVTPGPSGASCVDAASRARSGVEIGSPCRGNSSGLMVSKLVTDGNRLGIGDGSARDDGGVSRKTETGEIVDAGEIAETGGMVGDRDLPKIGS